MEEKNQIFKYFVFVIIALIIFSIILFYSGKYINHSYCDELIDEGYKAEKISNEDGYIAACYVETIHGDIVRAVHTGFVDYMGQEIYKKR